MDSYKAASYNVWKAVKEAKQRYGRKLESQLEQSDSRSLCQGLRTITDYKAPTSGMLRSDASLVDELNTFYAHFKAAANNAKANDIANGCRQEENANTGNAFIISEHDVSTAFRRVNTRKAAEPVKISDRVLRVCADQLVPVFTEIFNLSLTQSVIPTCFKESIIVPVPKKTHPASLNDYCPEALTSVVMKCLEQLCEEIMNLDNWCQRNNLLLNISKTKELIVDVSTKQERNYQAPVINESPVERVDSFRYLGVQITQGLSWSCHINTMVKKALQRLYHLRCLRDFRLPSKVLRNFYSCTIESILTGNIATCFGNSTMQDRRALWRVIS
ncbi:hypothetical protein QTP70_000956 [Hemibagrus guttatus]|uniref:Alkylated DNA repair protein AlkB homologue 8 N-terminal domain-containing protein n=1 Tax=Hemibagrus guttatus TaxID=175788 RepID=A0AAE0UQ84_9TELE|nr:hypothetical protein QTP70_000956 [Hemibagrus guttatus]KAK3534064.1 hypothetical protein QTP86_001188 [Hemibagrus guttatus]